jgi:hypothetical protein
MRNYGIDVRLVSYKRPRRRPCRLSRNSADVCFAACLRTLLMCRHMSTPR